MISAVSAVTVVAGLLGLPAGPAAAQGSAGAVRAVARAAAAPRASYGAGLPGGRPVPRTVSLGDRSGCLGRSFGGLGAWAGAGGAACSRVRAALAAAAASGSSFSPSGPARVMDTRNGTGGVTGPVAAGVTVSLQVAGAGGVPASGVSAVVLKCDGDRADGG
jgi:hypothetical protein